MLKNGALRQFLMALSLVAFLSAGFVTTSVVTARPAEAGGISSLMSVGMALGTLTLKINAYLALIQTEMIATWTAAAAVSTGVVEAKAAKVALNFNAWSIKTWVIEMLPALQEKAQQEVVVDAEQMKSRARFDSAANLNRARGRMEDDAIRAHRQVRPGENVVQAATLAPGMTRAQAFERAYGAAAPVERLARSSNKKGQASSAGRIGDMAARWDNYVMKYCRKKDNNGVSGCNADAPFAGRDIDVSSTFFSKDTIDLTDQGTRLAVDDLITNIAEPFVKDIIDPASVNTSAGISTFLRGESYKAKRQVIYDALYHIVARRAPGSTMGTFVRQYRQEAGVPAKDISNNPSKNELMQALVSERFRSGKYAIGQITEPENNKREMVIQQAFMLMQMNDQLDLMDKYALLLAASAGSDVRRANNGAPP